jgi:hypothetical protein
MIDRNNGVKMYQYSKTGILFWTFQGRIAQIVVFEPNSANLPTDIPKAAGGRAGSER